MDYKSLTSLLLRLTGAIILVAAVTATPRTFVDLYLRETGGGTNTETWLLTTAASAFPILAGLLLIYFPATVGNRIISGDGETADRERAWPVRNRFPNFCVAWRAWWRRCCWRLERRSRLCTSGVPGDLGHKRHTLQTSRLAEWENINH
jgi:hypothetical protein